MDHRKCVEFYFDYLSPYSYLAWVRLTQLEKEGRIRIDYRPVLFAGLLNHWGQLGPAEIPPRREWAFKQCFRFAMLHKIPFESVKYHPFNPVLALRISTKTIARDDQARIIRTLWEMSWAKGGDPSSETEILQALNENGLNGSMLIQRAPEAKDLLKTQTNEAIQRGAFGVPTLIAEGEFFFGNDSIEDLMRFLEGKDPLDRNKLVEVLNRPRKADRSVMKNRSS